MLKPDELNLGRNPLARLRTHVKPGDTVVINRKEQTLKILRFHNEKGFVNLGFQKFIDGFPTEAEKEVFKIVAAGVTIDDFFNFLLSVINLIATKVEFPESEGCAISPDDEHWLLDEHPEEKFHG